MAAKSPQTKSLGLILPSPPLWATGFLAHEGGLGLCSRTLAACRVKCLFKIGMLPLYISQTPLKRGATALPTGSAARFPRL
ncbi:hypothetical protein Riv7116_6906 [Rivularia sp. PCC 7116]|nr:hypothetical protein Riv7116_6906 [Rivularia sp. PCC 7116]